MRRVGDFFDLFEPRNLLTISQTLHLIALMADNSTTKSFIEITKWSILSRIEVLFCVTITQCVISMHFILLFELSVL